METINRPEMLLLEKGENFKILQVRAKAGMVMPQHHTTEEAVICVQEGEALLKMADGDHLMKKGVAKIIGAGEDHTLEVNKDFKAIVTMALHSEIEFQVK